MNKISQENFRLFSSCTASLKSLCIDAIKNGDGNKYFFRDSRPFYKPDKIGINHVPLTFDFLFAYQELSFFATAFGFKHYERCRYNSMGATARGIGISDAKEVSESLLWNIVYNDLTRANLFINTVAWLEIGKHYWHEDQLYLDNPHKEHPIPKDLSYGLVLTYYDFVIPFARFLLNIDRDMSCLSLEECALYSKEAHNFAIEQTRHEDEYVE